MDACLASHYIEVTSGARHGQSARPIRPAGTEAAYLAAFDAGDDPHRLSQSARTVGRADLQRTLDFGDRHRRATGHRQ